MTNLTITIDPVISAEAEAAAAALDLAQSRLAEATSELHQARAQLDALDSRLAQGDASVTTKALGDANLRLDRATKLRDAASRAARQAQGRVSRVPPVGVAQTLGALLGQLYPVPVTVTTDPNHAPVERPSLVFVVPTEKAAQLRNDPGWVQVPRMEAVLHRNSQMERHPHEAAILGALQPYGWDVRLGSVRDSNDGLASYLPLQIKRGFEWAPALVEPLAKNEVLDSLGVAVVTDGYGPAAVSAVVIAQDMSEGVLTSQVGVRLGAYARVRRIGTRYEGGGVRPGDAPKLAGAGDESVVRQLGEAADRALRGLTRYGRIASHAEVKSPAWASALPTLDSVGVYEPNWRGHAEKRTDVVNAPIAAWYGVVQIVSKAPTEAVEDEEDELA